MEDTKMIMRRAFILSSVIMVSLAPLLLRGQDPEPQKFSQIVAILGAPDANYLRQTHGLDAVFEILKELTAKGTVDPMELRRAYLTKTATLESALGDPKKVDEARSRLSDAQVHSLLEMYVNFAGNQLQTTSDENDLSKGGATPGSSKLGNIPLIGMRRKQDGSPLEQAGKDAQKFCQNYYKLVLKQPH